MIGFIHPVVGIWIKDFKQPISVTSKRRNFDEYTIKTTSKQLTSNEPFVNLRSFEMTAINYWESEPHRCRVRFLFICLIFDNIKVTDMCDQHQLVNLLFHFCFSFCQTALLTFCWNHHWEPHSMRSIVMCVVG